MYCADRELVDVAGLEYPAIRRAKRQRLGTASMSVDSQRHLGLSTGRRKLVCSHPHFPFASCTQHSFTHSSLCIAMYHGRPHIGAN